jgi:hypothetical protein
LRLEDFPLDPNHAAFFSHATDMVGRNPASTIQIRSFTGEIDAIDWDVSRQRERIREQYHAQEAQVIQNNRAQEAELIQNNRAQEAELIQNNRAQEAELIQNNRAQEAELIQNNRAQEAELVQNNRARLEADERELDAESDERHLRLRTHSESVLDLARFGQGASHGMPHESVSTRMPNNHSQFHIPDLLSEDQSRIVPWDRASSRVLEDLNPSRSNLTTSSMLGPEPRNHQAPVAGGNFHHSFLSVRLPSMDVDRNANEAFLDIVERQTLSSTAIGESHAHAVPPNMVPPHPDETPGVASAMVLPSDGARNGPNSQFERSPDSGYGSSHTLCMGCDTVLIGQNLCDTCARWLDTEPSFWFNG